MIKDPSNEDPLINCYFFTPVHSDPPEQKLLTRTSYKKVVATSHETSLGFDRMKDAKNKRYLSPSIAIHPS